MPTPSTQHLMTLLKAKDVLDELFSSELLKSILLGHFGDYGMRLGL